MGLDMYLNVNQYVRSYAPGFATGNDPEQDVPQRGTYNDILEAAGLSSLKAPASERTFEGLTVQARAAYWRKANQIFKWFEDNVCDGETENCKEYEVEMEQLVELRRACLTVLDNHALAEELLPTQSGFFFGDTAYDDYYFADLQDTVDMLSKILDNPELKDAQLEYHAWW